MADIHTTVERRLKNDIIAKNIIRRDMEKIMFLIRRLSEKLRKCKNHRNISHYNSTIKRQRKQVAQLRVELLQRNEDLEKRIREEREYSEKEVEGFKTRLEKETREMEEARSKLKKIKAVREKSENIEEQEEVARVMARATRRLLRETADVKKIEKELSLEEKDEILFTLELKKIESDNLIYGQ